MGADMSLPKPVFELGLKAYLYGEEAVKLARAADRVSAETGVTLVLTPQAVDVSRIAAVVRHVRVFTQHLDPVTVGRGIGSVLAEAAREAGATGALLNHAEKRLTLSELSRTIGRAREVGLATIAGYVRGPDAGFQLSLPVAHPVESLSFADELPDTATVGGLLRLELAGAGELRLTLTVPLALRADFDGDGRVNFGDFFLFADVFGRAASGAVVGYDLNGDGAIGLPDFFLFADVFGQVTDPA